MFVGIQTYSQRTKILVCDSFSIDKNKVVFNCNDNAKISLEFLDSKNIKFWVSPKGDFKRNNESFAVVNEVFDNSMAITVQDSNSAFEIFTGDLRVRVSKSPFNIQIFDKYQKLIMGDLNQDAYSFQDSYAITKKVLRQDEHFFGLGEKTGSLNRRGKSYVMWNSDKPCYSETEDPLYKSIPFFMSSYNYGIFFDNTYKTSFDFGNTSQDYFSFSAPNGPFIYYFMFGNDYKEIIGSYTKLTGKPIMPPKWALGWSQSRGMLTFEKLTRDIANEYRERNIPCDIIYQDIGWVEGLQNFKWRKDRYDNPKKMLSDLAENGFKVIVSQDPVISQTVTDQWQEAKEKGFLVTDERTGQAYDMPWPWGGNCGVVDFTNPDVADWWGELQQIPIADGVKGFWTDMGEPAWSNEESTDRLHMKHYLGMHDEIHNVYGLTWDKVVTEQFEKRNPNQRVFQMTRAAYAGMQRYTFGWSGDSGNGRDVLDGWDNLANQIPLGLSAGMGLVPFWTTDISGYCGEITDHKEFSELYIRWLQFGVFNPLSRAHHEGDNAVEPWLFGEEAEKIAKKSIEFKY
ncbi:MAG: glycoside hydrolase family 31 protein, partial [Candidatus Magasanikbacteria bacterium]|nr:glycoside hydrolase family 31 protein [Candidatus Magasanikbacteria bacterium]